MSSVSLPTGATSRMHLSTRALARPSTIVILTIGMCASVSQFVRKNYLRLRTSENRRSLPLALPVIGGVGSFASPGSITK